MIEDTYINPLTHRVYWFLQEYEGGYVKFGLLRSVEWLHQQGLKEVSDRANFDLKEFGVTGEAELIQITPCPTVLPGSGRPVTGWFEHSAGRIWELYVEGTIQPIRGTENHPIWSQDRLTWVPLCELQEGEQVCTKGSLANIVKVVETDIEEPVYNIEVEGDHCYRVGEQGLLVHNASYPGPNQQGGGPNAQSCSKNCNDVIAFYTVSTSPGYVPTMSYPNHQQGQTAAILASLGYGRNQLWIQACYLHQRLSTAPPGGSVTSVGLACDSSTGEFVFLVSNSGDPSQQATQDFQRAVLAVPVTGTVSIRWATGLAHTNVPGQPFRSDYHAEQNILRTGLRVLGIASSSQICNPGCSTAMQAAGVEYMSPPAAPYTKGGFPSTCNNGKPIG